MPENSNWSTMLFRVRTTKYHCLLVVVVLALVIICLHKTSNRNVIQEIESWTMSFVSHTKPVRTMRENLTFYPNISTGEIHLDTEITQAESIFNKYSSELQVVCPPGMSTRLGNAADGGWDMCLHASYRIKYPCLVYSFGINNEWSFDDAVVAKFNCTVRAFDPSMQVNNHRRGNNIWFYKEGIGGYDTVDSHGWTLHTLESFIRKFNESDAMIDYLKIDVEYSEWSALERILNSTVLSRVKQFGLETHSREIFKTPSTIQDFVYYSEILRRLQAAGFYRWYWHYNIFGVFVSKHTQQKLTCCYEMVFINVNIPYS